MTSDWQALDQMNSAGFQKCGILGPEQQPYKPWSGCIIFYMIFICALCVKKKKKKKSDSLCYMGPGRVWLI